MSPPVNDYEGVQRKTRASFICNLFWCKEKTTEHAPGCYVVECTRCGEIVSMYGAFKLGEYKL